MKKILITLLTFFLSFNFLLAEETETDELNLKSKSAIIIEATSKKVLYEKNSEELLAPASMTKIMTMLLIEEALEEGKINLDDEVVISENAASMGGSQIYLEANTKATVKELLTSIAIGSANDAAVAMAEKIGGTEENFVRMMNEKARSLGLINTTYKNPHGLDTEGHTTTAHDMTIVASELVKHEDILKYTGMYETTITHQNGKSIWLVNTNSLIKFYSGLDGLKTGFTDKAGYCLTGTMKRNDMRLITVVMNAQTKEDRNTDTINLMEYAYSKYYKKNIMNNNESLGKLFIDNTKKREINYYLKDEVSLIVDKNTRDVTYNYDIELDNVRAPLKKGDKIGSFILHYNNKDINYDLIVKKDVKESGYFRRLINYLKDILNGNINVINI